MSISALLSKEDTDVSLVFKELKGENTRTKEINSTCRRQTMIILERSGPSCSKHR